MKIAFFISSLNKGGAERTLVNLAEYFYQKNYEVLVVTQYQRENEYEISEGIPRIYSEITPEETTSSRIRNFGRRFHKLRMIWKQEKPDVILSFIGKNNFMAIATNLFLTSSVSVSVVGDPKEEYYTKSMRFLAKTLFAFADGVIVKTGDAKAFFPKWIQKKTKVMKNSLNPLFIRPTYQGVREKTIISVGRIDENKNQRMIIDAFEQVAERYPDYSLILYGEGELRASLQELVKEKQLEQRVKLPGAITNVADTIYKAGIFVLSSNTEGMPNALIEAMALGIPSISTDCPCGGPKDLITQKENGILVPVGEVSKLVGALEFLLANEELAKQIGQNAANVQQELHPSITNKAWEDYFLSCYQR